MTVVDLTPTLTPPGRASWLALRELASIVGIERWSVVGGQMVAIHGARFGVESARPTTDGDIVVDVRVYGREAMRQIADALVELGFVVEMSPEGVTRFVRSTAKIDLLAPEGVGTDVVTSPPGHAVQAPGATQALERSEIVRVRVDDTEFDVRSPALIGAIIAKAAATTIPGTNDERLRHQQDLAFLLSLAARTSVRPLADSLSTKDRTRLRSAAAAWIDNDLHQAWLAVDTHNDVRQVVGALLRSEL